MTMLAQQTIALAIALSVGCFAPGCGERVPRPSTDGPPLDIDARLDGSAPPDLGVDLDPPTCKPESLTPLGAPGLSFSDMAVGRDGELHVLAVRDPADKDELLYLRRSPGSTINQVHVASFNRGRIAVDRSGAAHLLYRAPRVGMWTPSALRYARISGLKIVEDSTLVPDSYGAFDIAIDRDDRTAAAYAVKQTGSGLHPFATQLRVTIKQQGGWNTPLDVGERIGILAMELLTDSAGRAHIAAVFDQGYGEFIVYSSDDGNLDHWAESRVPNWSEGLARPALAILGASLVALSLDQGVLKWSTRALDSPAGSWQQDVVAFPKSVATGGIVADDGNIELVFAPAADQRLLRTTHQGGGWSTPTELATDRAASFAMAVDARHGLHVVYRTSAGLAYRRICLQTP